MSIVVFLGPSLKRETAEGILNADYRCYFYRYLRDHRWITGAVSHR
jgi:hypothetical protein